MRGGKDRRKGGEKRRCDLAVRRVTYLVSCSPLIQVSAPENPPPPRLARFDSFPSVSNERGEVKKDTRSRSSSGNQTAAAVAADFMMVLNVTFFIPLSAGVTGRWAGAGGGDLFFF